MSKNITAIRGLMMKDRNPLAYVVLLNVASLVASIWLLLELKVEDRISVRRGCALSLLGFVYFMTLNELCVQAALCTAKGARFRSRFRLEAGDVMDICNKLVSAVQAVFSCITGAVVCLWSCTRDFMRASHVVSEGYAWFGAAYFFYDIYSMYIVHITMRSEALKKEGAIRNKILPLPKRDKSSGDGSAKRDGKETSFLEYCCREPVILMHHLFIGGFGFLVIVYLRGGLGDCVFGFVYLMELSTPFVSARGILSRLKLKASRAYLVNGIAMLLTFFVCRVASLPYVCLMYSRVLGLSYLEAIKSLPFGCKISICILLLPQLYWFCLMSVGAVKVFAGKGPRQQPLSAALSIAGDTDMRS